MSGGSFEYRYLIIEDCYVGNMFDKELDEMLKDLVKVLHDLEWWQSGDISEKKYRETVTKFKAKWFKRDKVNIERIIEKEFSNKKDELLSQFKYLED